MKRILLATLLLGFCIHVSAQGLRHSVCVVEPELSSEERALFGEYGLYMARAGMQSASRMVTAYKSEDLFGSGVMVDRNGKKYILTNLHVVGYAQTATIVFQLHDKTLRYPHCPIVKTSLSSDLAAIELPTECEMIALPYYQAELTEDLSVVAAGFPELAGKPSWQMTRGIISNARLGIIENASASHIIQHTASIDPGSSGGPLLYKSEDGKYSIIGINTWKAFYREGAGFAIGMEDVDAFVSEIGTPYESEKKALAKLQDTTGEDWLYIFRQLPDSTQKSLREMDWRLPLDPVLQALAKRDSLIALNGEKAKHFERSATRVITDMNHRRHVRLLYDNYFGMNQQAGVQAGIDWFGFFATGVQITALVLDIMTEDPVFGTQLDYANRAGAIFAIYLGGQIPIAVGKHIIAPRIEQSAGAGPLKTGNIHGGVCITTDTRVGLDWRVPFSDCDLIVGMHYNMDWLWTKDQLRIDSHKTINGFHQYLQHGIGLSIGVGF